MTQGVNRERRNADLNELSIPQTLNDAAEDHAEAMCAAGVATPSDDPDAAYGGGVAFAVAELVDSEPLDPSISDPEDRNAAATNAIWARWRTEPVVTSERWDEMGVGEVECADGVLYMTLAFREMPYGSEVRRVTRNRILPQPTGLSTGGRFLVFSDLPEHEDDPTRFQFDDDTGALTAETGFWGPMSDDLRYSAFPSLDPGLVPGDTNGASDVFVQDRTTGTITRISDADTGSDTPALSRDGRFVTYRTWQEQGYSVHLHDRTLGTTTKIHETTLAVGYLAASVSADGRYVVMIGNGVELWDLATGAKTLISPPEHTFCLGGDMSAGAGAVTFRCEDRNGVPGEGIGDYDVFVWDRSTSVTTPITTPDDGIGNLTDPVISADGRFVAYGDGSSDDDQGDALYLLDRSTGASIEIAPRVTNYQITRQLVISPDGNAVAFTTPNDRDLPGYQPSDLYLWQRTA